MSLCGTGNYHVFSGIWTYGVMTQWQRITIATTIQDIAVVLFQGLCATAVILEMNWEPEN